MTQAEPCPGPYRSDGYVEGISCGRVQGPYGTMAHIFGANAGQMAATARLLAASWDMREALQGLVNAIETDAAMVPQRMIAARSVLAEIETPVTSVPR